LPAVSIGLAVRAGGIGPPPGAPWAGDKRLLEDFQIGDDVIRPLKANDFKGLSAAPATG